jgi:hypothetical protein
MKLIKSWFSIRVEKELKDLASQERSHPRIAIAGAMVLIIFVLYLIAHQLSSTGFFTATFGTLEMLLLYGSLIEWITVAIFEALGRKHLSRDIDAFGGIFFVVFGGFWLFLVFPFEFTYFADLLPSSHRFLLQWISNDIARMIMILWIAINLGAAFYYPILRAFVRKELSKQK